MAERLTDLVAELDDEAFERLYGPLARLRPAEAAQRLDGIPVPWWIVGGWAIEAFTGQSRGHEDLDLSILAGDVPAAIDHLLVDHHVWAAGGGMLAPVLSADQELPSWAHQFWVREQATGPWLLDIIIAPDRGGRWVFRRDTEVERDLDAVTWTADDGLRYQAPEVTLAFKAAHQRPKDTADLDSALPLLTDDAKAWLGQTIARLHPGHDWLEVIV